MSQKFNAAFKKWFRKSKCIDTNGNPLVVYHGTTHQFYKFDAKNANPENYFGSGFYFTSSLLDCEHNYAGEGPDLTNKIESVAEKIFREKFEDGDEPPYGSDEYLQFMKEAEDEARRKVAGKAPLTMACYLSIQNPIYIKPKGGTVFEVNYTYEDNDPDKDIIGESGSGIELTDAIRDVCEYHEIDPAGVFSDISEKIGDSFDGATAYEIDQALRTSENFVDIYDPSGEFNLSSELIREIYDRMGYDGIIQDAWTAFGGGKKNGKPMLGITRDTTHYIVWNPKQIKSATGNDGTYDKDDADIRSNPWRHR